VTCVGHADLDYEWLPPAWEVLNSWRLYLFIDWYA
jgi:hypothetical protein